MAKFRDSMPLDGATSSLPPSAAAESSMQPEPQAPGDVRDRSIGDIISDARHLTADQVEQILQYQRAKGLRFGEAAIALGMATPDDVLHALAQQFHYPYSPADAQAHRKELVVLNQPFSRQAEAFRAVRSQLTMRVFSGGEPRPALAVVSADSGDGKTFFCANLGVALAQLGGRTLIIDADLRGPRMHELFGIDNGRGLSGILAGRAESQVIRQVDGVPGLCVLPAGITPPNPVELVERPAFGLLMRELSSKFDHVIVDTPAAEYGADCGVIAARCGAALVIARRDESRVAALQDLVAFLAEGSAKVAGVVFNEH